MRHIVDPKNVDMIIESPPLSDKEREEISKFIKEIKQNERTKSTLKRISETKRVDK